MKKRDVIFISIMYLIAYGISGFLYSLVDNPMTGLIVFTFSATIIIWIFGVLLKNSSVYDPYWSVTPVIMLLVLMIDLKSFGSASILIFSFVLFWSFRLTHNWYKTFKDLKTQDWRYDMYKNKYPKAWFFLNLFGINLMPTLITFFAMMPLFLIVISDLTFRPLMIIGLIIMLFGTILELFSDKIMHDFLKQDQKEMNVCNVSLYKYSRHPNYLGEIMFWLGAYLVLLFTDFSLWYFNAGVIMVFFLFYYVSIPLMEKRLVDRRKGYKEYQKKVSVLLLLPQKKED